MKDRFQETVVEKYSLPEEIRVLADKAFEGLAPYEERLLKPFIKGGERRILDVGCGPGREAIPLLELGHFVAGIDISEGMLVEARRNIFQMSHKVRLARMNALHLGFLDNSFDLVLMLSQILACIPGRHNRVSALMEAGRVLKPGGYALFSTHSRNATPVKQRRWKIINAARQMARALAPDYPLEEGDTFVAHVSGRTLTPLKMFIHIYSMSEAIEDINAAGLEFIKCLSAYELESGKLNPVLRERDRYLFYISRKPSRAAPL